MEYSYEILSKDETNKVMVVRYSAEGQQSIDVSAHIPSTEENLKLVIHQYAPLWEWERAAAEIQTVSEGTTGSIISDHPEYTAEEWAAIVAENEAAEAAAEAAAAAAAAAAATE